MKPPPQAERIKAIKAALSAAADMGLKVVAFRVTYAQGVPCVDVQTESPPPAPQGGAALRQVIPRPLTDLGFTSSPAALLATIWNGQRTSHMENKTSTSIPQGAQSIGIAHALVEA